MTQLTARRRAIRSNFLPPVLFDSAADNSSVASGSGAFTHVASAAGVKNAYMVVVSYGGGTAPTINGASCSLIGQVTAGPQLALWGRALGSVAPNTSFAIQTSTVDGGSVLYGGVQSVGPFYAQDSSNGAGSSMNTTPLSSRSTGAMMVAAAFGSNTAADPGALTSSLNEGTGSLASRWSHSDFAVAWYQHAFCDVAESAVEDVSIHWSPFPTTSYFLLAATAVLIP